MNHQTIEVVKELRGDTCQCNGSKISGHTFCRACFLKLPVSLRSRLYKRVGQGYEKAYADALAHLKGSQ